MVKGDAIDYSDKWINDWDGIKMNQYVITGAQQNTQNSLVQRIGRIVQIRPSEGMFGGDVTLIRLSNGVLSSHDNQSYHTIQEDKIEYLDEIFKDVYLDDPDKQEYSIVGEDKRLGFYAPMFKKGDVVKIKQGVLISPEHIDYTDSKFIIEEFYYKPFMKSMCGNYEVSSIVCDVLELDALHYRKLKIKNIINNV